MRDAVIVEAVRTPVGRRNGALSTVHPIAASAHVLTTLIERTGLDPALVDDVIWGCVQQVGSQANDIGRSAVLAAGWPESVPGVTIDRQCGSSQQSVHFAAAGIIAGQYDVVVAGGVEMMSLVPIGANLGDGLGVPFTDSLTARYGVDGFNQGLGAELMAEKWGLDRTRLDEYSARSHRRASEATDQGLFREEIAPIEVDGVVITDDGGIRRDTTVDRLAGLRPAFKPDGVIHAGNASQISDGAAGLLITTSELAAQHGLRPLARFHTGTVAGADPVMMLSAPIPATQKVLQRAGLTMSDIGTFEVNEAFAPVPMAWLAEMGAPDETVNPQGGAIALGHPLGASGARLMTTLVHRMKRDGIRYGLQTMCEGGGQANATVLELL